MIQSPPLCSEDCGVNGAVSIANQAACLHFCMNHVLCLAQLLAKHPAAFPGEALKGTRARGVTRGQGKVEGEATGHSMQQMAITVVGPTWV